MSELDTSTAAVTAIFERTPFWGAYEKSVAFALLAERNSLYAALSTLMRDVRFQVAIGGNPNAVAALMAQIEAALEVGKRSEKAGAA